MWTEIASCAPRQESGRSEIYVQPFRPPGAKVRVSRNGGQRPRWRSDGRELFFQSGQSILAVAVEPREEFVSGKPTTLFKLDGPFEFQDAMPDGQRFLVLIEPSPADSQPIHVMLDWREFLPDTSQRTD